MSIAGGRLEAAGLGLMAGGASGNIFDRMERGKVTDFIDFHLAEWHWPAFNLADVAIVVGALILVSGSFLSPQQDVIGK
jgi:signal peptidase II